MSWSIHLFVDGPDSLDALSREIGDFLHISFNSLEEDGDRFYDFDDKRYCFVSVRRNYGLDNDRDMNFEDFAYEMKVQARRVSDWQSAREACLKIGRETFEGLKRGGRYKLMLTHQLDTKLDSFSPEAVT